MFSLHYFTAFIILFFLFYNAIGIGKTITHKWFINKKRWIDLKSARWTLKVKRLTNKEINEISYKKLTHAPIFLVILYFPVSLIFPKSNAVLFFFGIAVISTTLLSIGLTSFRRLIQGVKEGFRSIISNILLVGVAIVLLILAGEQELLKDTATELNLDSFSYWTIIILALIIFCIVNVIVWIVLRTITKLLLRLIIGFIKLCYLLNNNSPLRPFYFIIQIISVIISEVVIKIISN